MPPLAWLWLWLDMWVRNWLYPEEQNYFVWLMFDATFGITVGGDKGRVVGNELKERFEKKNGKQINGWPGTLTGHDERMINRLPSISETRTFWVHRGGFFGIHSIFVPRYNWEMIDEEPDNISYQSGRTRTDDRNSKTGKKFILYDAETRSKLPSHLDLVRGTYLLVEDMYVSTYLPPEAYHLSGFVRNPEWYDCLFNWFLFPGSRTLYKNSSTGYKFVDSAYNLTIENEMKFHYDFRNTLSNVREHALECGSSKASRKNMIYGMHDGTLWQETPLRLHSGKSVNNADGATKLFEGEENRCAYHFLPDGYLEGYNLNVDESGFISWTPEMGNMMSVVFASRLQPPMLEFIDTDSIVKWMNEACKYTGSSLYGSAARSVSGANVNDKSESGRPIFYEDDPVYDYKAGEVVVSCTIRHNTAKSTVVYDTEYVDGVFGINVLDFRFSVHDEQSVTEVGSTLVVRAREGTHVVAMGEKGSGERIPVYKAKLDIDDEGKLGTNKSSMVDNLLEDEDRREKLGEMLPDGDGKTDGYMMDNETFTFEGFIMNHEGTQYERPLKLNLPVRVDRLRNVSECKSSNLQKNGRVIVEGDSEWIESPSGKWESFEEYYLDRSRYDPTFNVLPSEECELIRKLRREYDARVELVNKGKKNHLNWFQRNLFSGYGSDESSFPSSDERNVSGGSGLDERMSPLSIDELKVYQRQGDNTGDTLSVLVNRNAKETMKSIGRIEEYYDVPGFVMKTAMYPMGDDEGTLCFDYCVIENMDVLDSIFDFRHRGGFDNRDLEYEASFEEIYSKFTDIKRGRIGRRRDGSNDDNRTSNGGTVWEAAMEWGVFPLLLITNVRLVTTKRFVIEYAKQKFE